MIPTARYDEVADFYEQFAPDRYTHPPMLALLDLIGDVAGLRLLDLACGHGRLARELARRGAQVVGVDLSAALLEKARAYEEAEPLQIAYVHADATSPAALAGQTFDGAACSFGLSRRSPSPLQSRSGSPTRQASGRCQSTLWLAVAGKPASTHRRKFSEGFEPRRTQSTRMRLSIQKPSWPS